MSGRPTKLDDLRAKRIIDALRCGNTRRAAAKTAGIASSTMREWCRRGRQGEEPFSAFLASLKKAEAEAETAQVEIVLGAARAGTWQAAAWWLERRRPQWRSPDVQLRSEIAKQGQPPRETITAEQARAELAEMLATDPELRFLRPKGQTDEERERELLDELERLEASRRATAATVEAPASGVDGSRTR